ncbi:DM13 domain-containing protein [soil metagenome]
MKFFSILIISILIMGCQPEATTPTKPINGIQVDFTGIAPLKQGMFIGIGGHTASGTVFLYEKSGKKYIVFDPYSSQAGPDLKVYLSKDEGASEYIRVGQLQSTMGKQTYEIIGNPDLSAYSFVHIWCEQFSVGFARAPVK